MSSDHQKTENVLMSGINVNALAPKLYTCTEFRALTKHLTVHLRFVACLVD